MSAPAVQPPRKCAPFVQPPRKRALIFAGGGLKVAFQAGVLQVWLDEVTVPLDFELADGASGGTFNLAMWCQGMSGTEIADAWRKTRPLRLIGLNLRFWRSLLTFGRFRRNILAKTWELDWDTIRKSSRRGTFNTYNFTKNELRLVPHTEMDENKLVACVSLPGWFPPMKLDDGNDYIDAVYASDANLEEAIHSGGATELWVIWTVSTLGRWRNGPHRWYFQVVEAAADWNFKHLQARIEKSNAKIKAGKGGEFPHLVEVKVLRHDVPIDYLMVFRAKSLRRAVELGVEEARKWCTEKDIAWAPLEPAPSDPTSLRFTETMTGHFAFDVDDPELGDRDGTASGTDLCARLTISLKGVDRFLDDPTHTATLTGTIRSDALGGELAVESGELELFPVGADPRFRKMKYKVDFRDGAGHLLTLHGEKHLTRTAGWHPWRATTTLYTTLTRGPNEEPVGAGVIRITLLSLLRQLLTFRARGRRGPAGGFLAGIWLIVRFQVFFVGQVCGVYLKR